VRVRFAKPDAPEQIVAEASWDGSQVRFDAEEQDVREALQRIFRPTPIVLEDRSLLPAGTSGAVELEPGSLQWFLGAARVRAEAAGFKAVFVPEGTGQPGWDPAGGYRPFARQVERL
jgi:hypothetical protein